MRTRPVPSVPPRRAPAVIGLALLLVIGLVVPVAADGCGLVGVDGSLVGAGTADNPYEIAAAEDLARIVVCGVDQHYEQTGDIDLLAGDPERRHTAIEGEFTGVYDGGGFTIDSFQVDAGGRGMFTSIGAGGVVRDLTLRGVNVPETSWRTGALAGDNFAGSVIGVHVTGDVQGVRSVGGLLGLNDGLVRGSSADVVVSGRSELGGLVGENDSGGVVEASSARGDVHARGQGMHIPVDVGGLAGVNAGDIIDSSSYGEVIAGTAPDQTTIEQASRIGGLVGTNSANITDAHAHGDVSVTDGASVGQAGGLVGVSEGGTISGSTAAGAVTVSATGSAERVGGLVGDLRSGATVTSGRATGSVTAIGGDGKGEEVRYIGGLVGNISDSGQVTDSVASGAVVGRRFVGGLVGYAGPATILRSSASGTVSGVQAVGGLVGYTEADSLIERSTASGAVTASGDDVGGLVGDLRGATLRSSFATGAVTGTEDVGGLVGEAGSGSIIEDAYAMGPSTGVDYVGGLVGYGLGQVTRAYAVGVVTVTESGTKAGLIGLFSDPGVATASFWSTSANPGLTGTTGSGDAAGVVGLASAQLTDRTSFADAGWAIVDRWSAWDPPAQVWGICSGHNAGRPYLLWSETSDPCGSSQPGGGGGGGGGGAPPVGSDSPPPPGAPLAVLPGQGGALIDGQPVELTFLTNGQGGTTVTGDGFALSVDPLDDRPGQAGELELILQRNRGARVTATGFQPRSRVTLYLHSDPVLLGSFMTDDAGSAQADSTVVPDEVSACPHVLRAEGQLPSGAMLEVSIGVWVEAGSWPFNDVPATNVHARAIGCLADEGIVAGVHAGEYRPAAALTRGQAATLLAGIFGLDTSGTSSLPDVSGSTHEGAIAALLDAGSANGTGEGGFAPDQPVTRGQFATLLAGMLALEPEEPDFPDAGEIHAGAIGALAREEVLVGYADGTYRPETTITRAQVASMLVRIRRLLSS